MQKYFFSLLVICASFSVWAQESSETILSKRQAFVRVGYDLSRIGLPYVGKIGSKGWELSVDGEIKYNWFPIVEVGGQSVKNNTDTLQYEMSGSYVRIGLDYNILKYKHRLDRDIFFVGCRIAQAKFSHEAPCVIINSITYGVLEIPVASADINALWAEAVVGVKGELLRNLFMGVTVRAKAMLKHTEYEQLTPYIVPGFGKGFNKFNAGITYSLMYSIPLSKR